VKKLPLSSLSFSIISLLVVGCGAANLNETQGLSLKKKNTADEYAQSRLSGKRASVLKSSASQKGEEQIEKGGNVSLSPVAAPSFQASIASSQVAPVAEKALAASPQVAAAPAPASAVKQEVIDSPQLALERQALEFKQRIMFLDLTYRACLGRAPDSGGLVSWSNLIASKQATFDQVQAAICSSPEGQIALAYSELLGRFPDPAGRGFWLAELNSGRLSILQIRQSIASSDERKAIDLQQKIQSLKAELAAVEKERSSIVQKLQSI